MPASEPPEVSVLIVDDHPVVRDGLAMMLDSQDGIRVIGVASEGAAGVRQAVALQPDVVLMDLAMPGVDGIEATRLMTASGREQAIVVLTTFGDAEHVMAALDAGAVGYLMKDATPEEIAGAVRSAGAGESPLDPRVARTLIDARRAPLPGSREPHLTAKQTEILALLAEGGSNRQIARRLGISEKTVKAHLTQVYAALEVTDRVQAALWYRANH